MLNLRLNRLFHTKAAQHNHQQSIDLAAQSLGASGIFNRSNPTKTPHMKSQSSLFHHPHRQIHEPQLRHHHLNNYDHFIGDLFSSFDEYKKAHNADAQTIALTADTAGLFDIVNALSTPKTPTQTKMNYTIHDYLHHRLIDHANRFGSAGIQKLVEEHAFSLDFHQLQLGYGHKFDEPHFGMVSEQYLDAIYRITDDEIRENGTAAIFCMASVDHHPFSEKHGFFIRLTYPQSDQSAILRVEVINTSLDLALEEDQNPPGTPDGKQWLLVNHDTDLYFDGEEERIDYLKSLIQDYQYISPILLNDNTGTAHYPTLADLQNKLAADGLPIPEREFIPTYQTPQKGEDCGPESHFALWRVSLNDGTDEGTSAYKALKKSALQDAKAVVDQLFETMTHDEVDPIERNAGRMLDNIDMRICERMSTGS